MLGITKDFAVTKIEKNKLEKTINIHIEYLPKTYSKNGKEYAIYDRTPVRKWQHLNWFEYKCYLIGSLPRYIAEDGKPKVIDINFAPPQKGYTHLFAREIIYALKKVRVQSTVADLFNTTDYIVRSIMESAVENGLEERGLIKDFKNISLDEKAYTKGHHYATILKNADNRTENQQSIFEQLIKDNLKTSQAWLIRENFKGVFTDKQNAESNYKQWKENALTFSIHAVNKVIATFDRHLKGIINAIITSTSSAKHENKNGAIQSVIAKARGFRNFERFRINILFYFGNLKLVPQNI